MGYGARLHGPAGDDMLVACRMVVLLTAGEQLEVTGQFCPSTIVNESQNAWSC